MARTLQFFDVASDDSCRSTFHAVSLKFLLCHLQERTAFNLLFLQDAKVFIIQVIGKFLLKVADERFRVPCSDVGDGRRLGSNDRASQCL